MNFIHITDITFTSGSATVTVNSSQNIEKFKKGDLIFVIDQLPVIIESISANAITLSANSTFTLANGTAAIVAATVQLRNALDTIQTNNANWAKYFAPFLVWMASTNDTEPMEDSTGTIKQVRTPHKLDAMADSINTAAANLGTLEQDVQDLADTVNSQQTALDASRDTAVNAKNDAEAAKNSVDTTKGQIDTINTNLTNKYNDFDTKYLGSKATAPTLDNQGNALVEGMLYWDETENTLRNYDGAAWQSDIKAAVGAVTASSASASAAATSESNSATNASNAATSESNAATSASTAIDAKNDAETARSIALAAANFKGEWSDQTGAASIPYAVKEGSGIYMLLAAQADITASQPSVDTGNWTQIASVGSTATDSNRLGGELPAFYATAAALAALTTTVNGKEDTITKNTAFNKNFGDQAGEVSEGNHTHADLQNGINTARILALAAL